MREQAIEQLWYTWSSTGLEKQDGGFQVRAASPGLRDVRGERIQILSRYLRYELPAGTNRDALDPQDAPLGLALADIGQERVLLQKAYTGKDGRGRYGNYFIHLLAGLPSSFSAQDAIALWRCADLWQKKDIFSPMLQLPTLSLQQLKEKCERAAHLPEKFLSPEELHKAQKFLYHVILAFLVQQEALEQQAQAEKADSGRMQKTPDALRKNPFHSRETKVPRIYIAATPDQVAYFIWALARVLPSALLRHLTFSTYEQEYELLKQPYLLIGTCQAPVPSKATSSFISSDPAAQPREILEESCYRDGLALNIYTGRCSDQLKEIPYAKKIRFAAEFASFAAEALRTGIVEELDEVLKEVAERAREGESISVASFLARYNLLINELGKLSSKKLLEIIASADGRDLSRSSVRRQLIQEALEPSDQRFRGELQQKLKNASARRASNPALDKAFNALADEIIQHMVQQAEQRHAQGFIVLSELLDALDSPLAKPLDLSLYISSNKIKQMVETIANSDSASRLDVVLNWLEARRKQGQLTAQDTNLVEQACRTLQDYEKVLRKDGPSYLRAQQPALEALCLNLFDRLVKDPYGGLHKQELLFSLFEATEQDRVRYRLLQRARLSKEEYLKFIQSFLRPELTQAALRKLSIALLAEVNIEHWQDEIAPYLSQHINDALDLQHLLISMRISSNRTDKILSLLCAMAKSTGRTYCSLPLVEDRDERILFPYIRIIPKLRVIFDDQPDEDLKNIELSIWAGLTHYPSEQLDRNTSRSLQETFAHLRTVIDRAGTQPDWDNYITESWQDFARQYCPGGYPPRFQARYEQPPLLKRIGPVLWMRFVLRLGNARQISQVWQRHHDILEHSMGSFGKEQWQRLKLARNLHVAYKLVAASKRSIPQTPQDAAFLQRQQEAEQDLHNIIQEIKKFEKNYSFGRSLLNSIKIKRTEKTNNQKRLQNKNSMTHNKRK